MPHWPNARPQGPAPFPDFTYGQSLMCVTIPTNVSNLLATNLMIDRPYIYSSNITESAAAALPAFNSWVDHDHSSALTNVSAFQSLAGVTYYQFAKSKYWGEDLWDDLVAPYFETPLYVETWRNGAGGRMSSICGPNATGIVSYDIYEVENMEMENGVSWKGTQDHSKWALAARSINASRDLESGSITGALAACVGDINRMCSQENRGGGALCTQSDSNLWLSFNNTVVDLESCFEYYPCGGSGSQCWWCPTAAPTAAPDASSSSSSKSSHNDGDDDDAALTEDERIAVVAVVAAVVAAVVIVAVLFVYFRCFHTGSSSWFHASPASAMAPTNPIWPTQIEATTRHGGFKTAGSGSIGSSYQQSGAVGNPLH